MNPSLALIGEGKKFMWDGRPYGTRDEASCAKETYQNDNFEVRMVEEGGMFLLYTRRVVKQVVVSA